MKQYQRVLLFALSAVLAAGVALFWTPTDTSAQSSGGYRLTPLRSELTIERGQSDSVEITAQNVTGAEQLTAVNLLDFVPNPNETGQAKIIVDKEAYGDNPFSLEGFVELPEPRLTEGENAEATFTVNVTVPQDAQPGSYFGVLQVGPASISDLEGGDGSAVGLSATVGSLLLVTVPGDTVELLSLEEVSAGKDGQLGSFFSSAPDAIVLRIRNDGNVFSKPFGNVLLKDWQDNIIQEYEINEGSPPSNVLPDSVRRFEKEIGDIGWGRFKIETNLSYGNGSSVITVTDTFWVIPWVPILIVLALIIGVIFMSTRGLKAYNRRILKGSRSSKNV